MAKLFTIEGEVKEVKPANGTDFKLKELYNLIGCSLIEVVHLDNDEIMIVDEEGWVKEDPKVNLNATRYFALHNMYQSDAIAGNAIVCKTTELK